MKKIIFLIGLILLSFSLFAQTGTTLNNFVGVVQYSGATTSGVTIGEYVVTMGSFSDQTNLYNANDIEAGDIAWDNSGRRWRVDTVLTSNLLSADVEVTALTAGAGGPFGVGFVNREVNGLGSFPPDNSTGISQQLKSRVETHYNAVIRARLPAISESSRTLYVRDGAILTPRVGDINAPFPHPWAAADSAMAGDLIYIFSGSYTMGDIGSGADFEIANNGFNSDNSFLKDSVYIYADEGAVVRNETTFESYMMYDTVGMNISIQGNIEFSAATSTLIIFVNEPDGNEQAIYDIRGRKLQYGDGGFNQQVVDVRRAKYFNWDFKELETYGTRLFGFGSGTDADTTENMTLFINHDYIDTRNGGSNLFVKNGGTLDSSRIAFTFGIWEGTGGGDAMGLFERAVTNCTYTIEGQFNATGYSKLLGGSRGDFHNNNILVNLVYRSNTELFNEFYKDQLQTNTEIVTDRSTLKIMGSYHYTGSGQFLRFGGNSTPPGLDLIVDANVMSYNSQVMEFQSGNTRVSANIVGGIYETDAAGQPVIKISTNQQSGNPGTDNGGIFITNARFKNQNDTAVIISTVANQKVNVGGLYAFGNDLTRTPQTVNYLPLQSVGNTQISEISRRDVIVDGANTYDFRVNNADQIVTSSNLSQNHTSATGDLNYIANAGRVLFQGDEIGLNPDSTDNTTNPGTQILLRNASNNIRLISTDHVYRDTLSFSTDTNPAASVFTPNRRVDVSVSATGADNTQFGLPTPGAALGNVEIYCFVFDDSTGDCSVNSGATTLIDPAGNYVTTYTFPNDGLYIIRCKFNPALGNWYWVMN
jgi:hypothetical protein